MHSALLILAATEGAKPSKTPFYLAGALLIAFAVIVAAIGIVRDDFPSSRGAARGVMAIAALLVAVTMATSVLTA